MLQRIYHLICYLLLFLCMLLLSVFYRQPFFVFACLLLLFLPFLSYYAARHAFQACEISLQAIPAKGTNKSRIPLLVNICNPTWFPLIHMEITVQISSFYRPTDEKEILILPVLLRTKNQYRFFIHYTRIGCYQIQAINCKSYDYLHMFSFQKKCVTHADVHILPTHESSIRLDDSYYSEGFDEFDDVSGTGFTNADISDVREYIPGDRLQKIHWKLSGKLQKLMVKESSQGAMHCFIVLAELYFEQSSLRPDTLDASIENAYAVCRELYQRQEPCFFAVYSIQKEDFLTFRIQTKDDLEEAFTQILYEKPYTEKDLAYTYFKAAEIMKGTVIHVTHEGIEDYEMD